MSAPAIPGICQATNEKISAAPTTSMYASGGAMQSILKPQMQMAVPRWSPDGKFIAYIGGLMSDQGSTGGDIYIVPAGGGAPRDVTPGIKASPSWLTWRGPNQILFAEDVDGNSGVAKVDITSGKINTLWSAPEHIAGDLEWGMGLSLAADGNSSAVARSSFTQPPEIWAGAIGQWQPVTRLNSDIHPLWGETRSVHWMSHDLKVQGWLVFPRDYDASRKYPMIVEVHGGSVTAHSAGEGQGTTFTVTLPLARDVANLQPTRREMPVAPAEDRLDGVHVLIVDDDDDGRALVVAVLGRSLIHIS